MKKLALFMTALLVASFGFANNATQNKTQSSVATAWKASASKGIALDHDINMVYGGQDLSPRHELVATTTFA